MGKHLLELQKTYHESELAIRRLKEELSAAQVKEAAAAEGNDAKHRGLLQKIKILEEELSSAR